MDILVYLRDLVIVLGFAVIIVTIFHRFKLPSIAGFILSGILVGPKGLGLIDDVNQVEVLAEIGVALLLFGIGLELSLDKLKYNAFGIINLQHEPHWITDPIGELETNIHRYII